MMEKIPDFQRTAADCRIKRLKENYMEVKQQNKKSGGGGAEEEVMSILWRTRQGWSFHCS